MREDNRYMVWPVFWLPDGEPSVPDSVFYGIWMQLQAEGKTKQVFYGGTITSPQALTAFLRSPAVHVCLVGDQVKQELAFLAWLSEYEGTAIGHFVSLGKYRLGAGEAVLRYWKKLGVSLVLGITPENNQLALRLIRHLGFHVFPSPIPKMCIMEGGDRLGAMISFREL